LEACEKLILNTHFSLSPCGDINTTPAPAPLTLFNQSKYIVQTLDRSGGHVFCSSNHYAIKSGKTWDLMAFHFSYMISREEILIPHKETHHVASGLFSIFDSGA
jgi:hypothetical protein